MEQEDEKRQGKVSKEKKPAHRWWVGEGGVRVTSRWWEKQGEHPEKPTDKRVAGIKMRVKQNSPWRRGPKKVWERRRVNWKRIKGEKTDRQKKKSQKYHAARIGRKDHDCPVQNGNKWQIAPTSRGWNE